MPIYDRKLEPEDVLARIERYHKPYHRVLDDSVRPAASRVRRGLACQLPFDAVLRQPQPRAAQGDHGDFVLGDRDGTTCERDFTDFVARFLRGLGYDVRINEGYKGVEIVRRQGRPAANRHSLQIEVDRSLYMDQKTLEKLPGFDQLQPILPGWSRRYRRLRAFTALGEQHPDGNHGAPAASAVCRRGWRRRCRAAARRGRPCGRSRRRSTAMPCWYCAARISTTSGRWRSRGISASWSCRAAAAPMSSGGCGPRCRIFPTLTSRTGCAGATTRAASTSSATGSGIPTARSGACPRCCRCSMPIACRDRARSAPARPNSPICAPPMTRCRKRQRQRSPIWSRCTTSPGRAPSSGLPICCSARRTCCRRCRSASCAPIRARDARRFTSPRMPRRSSAGRCPTGGFCCAS